MVRISSLFISHSFCRLRGFPFTVEKHENLDVILTGKHDMRPFSCGVVSYERLNQQCPGEREREREREREWQTTALQDEWEGGKEEEDSQVVSVKEADGGFTFLLGREFMRKSLSHNEDRVIDEGNGNGPDFALVPGLSPASQERLLSVGRGVTLGHHY